LARLGDYKGQLTKEKDVLLSQLKEQLKHFKSRWLRGCCPFII